MNNKIEITEEELKDQEEIVEEKKIATILCNKCGEQVSPAVGFTCANLKCPIGSAAHTH